MPVQVIVDRVAETMTTEIYVYRVTPESGDRRILTSDGRWVDAGPAGVQVLPTYVVPDDVVSHVVSALGVPMSDVHLLESLRHERSRVDRVLDRILTVGT